MSLVAAEICEQSSLLLRKKDEPGLEKLWRGVDFEKSVAVEERDNPHSYYSWGCALRRLVLAGVAEQVRLPAALHANVVKCFEVAVKKFNDKKQAAGGGPSRYDMSDAVRHGAAYYWVAVSAMGLDDLASTVRFYFKAGRKFDRSEFRGQRQDLERLLADRHEDARARLFWDSQTVDDPYAVVRCIPCDDKAESSLLAKIVEESVSGWDVAATKRVLLESRIIVVVTPETTVQSDAAARAFIQISLAELRATTLAQPEKSGYAGTVTTGPARLPDEKQLSKREVEELRRAVDQYDLSQESIARILNKASIGREHQPQHDQRLLARARNLVMTERLGLGAGDIRSLAEAKNQEELFRRFAAARQQLSLDALVPSFSVFQEAIGGVGEGWSLEEKRRLMSQINACARALDAVLVADGARGLLNVASKGKGSFQLRMKQPASVTTLRQRLPLFGLASASPTERA